MLSIILPVINEEETLPDVLARLQYLRQLGHEIIVVDGGSRDNSLMLAQQAADNVIVSQPGRAVQMNSGAELATGDVLLFLHADTVLPEGAEQILSEIEGDTFWGRFDVRLSGERLIFRIIESMMNLRSRITSVATGDQAIFIKRSLFEKVGGYPEIALMEDIAISKQLRRVVKPVCVRNKVVTSSRRWEDRGIIKTIFLMWKLRLYYFFGMSPQKISRMYR
jgi:rSAM/selenodomain-associated transferase 2